MSGLRTATACLESAWEELSAHMTAQAIANASAKGDLRGAAQAALNWLRAGNSMRAMAVLQDALERNRL